MTIPDTKVHLKRAVATIGAGSFVQNMAVMAILLSLPTMAEDLETSIFMIVWVLFGYAIATQTLIVPMGKLGDIYGRKWIYILGLIIAASVAALASVSGDASQLIGLRVIGGIGAAMTLGTSSAQVIDIAPEKARGRSIGILTSGASMGIVMGPIVGSLILTATSWRGIFTFIAIAEIPLIIAAIILLPNIKPSSDTRRKFDMKGGILFSSTIITLLLGFTTIGINEIPIWFSYLLFLLAITSLALFILIERNKDNPLIDLKLLKIMRYSGGISVAIPASMVLHSLPFIMVIFLQSVRNLSPTETAAVLVFLSGVQLLSLGGGWLSDRIGPGIPIVSGLSIFVIGFLVLFFRGSTATIPELMLMMSFIGVGSALISAPVISMALGSLPKRNLGVGSGLLANLRFVGGLISQAIVIAILGLVLGQSGEISNVVGSTRIFDQTLGILAIRYAFLASMIYSAFALMLALFLIKKGIGRRITETSRKAPE